MAQKLAVKPYDGEGISTQGIRLLLKNAASALDHGFRFMGFINAPSIVQTIERLELFNAASGKNEKIKDEVSQTGIELGFTAQEFFALSFQYWMYSNEPSKIAADANAAASPETVIAGETGDQHGLEFGRQTQTQRDALVVHNVTDAADLTEGAGNDYLVKTVYGWTVIELLNDTHKGDTLRIGTGVNGNTDYNYNQLEALRLAPMTRTSQDVKAILQIPSAPGVNLEWRIDKATINPDGDISLPGDNKSTKNFKLILTSNAANDPTYPFGKLDYYGVDDGGAAVI